MTQEDEDHGWLLCQQRQPHPAHGRCPGQTVPGEDPALPYISTIVLTVEASGSQAQAKATLGSVLREVKQGVSRTAQIESATVVFNNEGTAQAFEVDVSEISVKRGSQPPQGPIPEGWSCRG